MEMNRVWTYWYEQRAGALYPVDSVYWDTGMDF